MTGVRNTRWVTIQCHAFCSDCEWYKHGGSQRSEQAIIVRAARHHVEATAHTVQLERGQTRETAAGDTNDRIHGGGT